ncbi:MAG: efflux RND transporter periplasmic adaptor subunit [Chloroflexi bacterium]|nr:efflux RND transporter periplasmic adaptor subunit [Chloroflexota bacterium]
MKKMIVGLMLLTLILAACSTGQPTPTPVASTVNVPAVVTASGKVLPTRWANLSFQTGGALIDLKVQTGDRVQAGEVIAQLDDTDAKLAVSQAEAALAIAQAQLAQIKAGGRVEEITVAEQAVKAAEANTQNATAQLAQLQAGARSADIAAAEADVSRTAAEVVFAQQAYDGVLKGQATAKEYGISVGGLGEAEEKMRAQLASIKAQHEVAVKRLAQVKAGATWNEVTAARASVDAAQAQQTSAQAQLALLKAGAAAEQIAVAEAQVKQAQVTLETAKSQLAKLQLVAPFDGTLGTVYVRSGEMMSPGQSIVTLGDLASLRIETTDLSEADIARVREGATASVTFDALPGQTIKGTVTRIAPMSTPGVSAVNYTVIVELDQLDPALRWGMTAFVDVQIGQ